MIGSRTVRAFAMLSLIATPCAHADDNNVAHRLLEQGNPAQAAEIFTDPAWKGVALYRSEQWWRAAEAFVRANTVESLYNLGNAYVKLGYFSLALEAYLAVLSQNPNHADAIFNADLMREIISRDEDNKGAAGLTPKAKEIDRLEKEKEEERDGGQRSEDSDESEESTQSDADNERKDKTTESEDQQTGQTATSGGNNDSRDAQREQNETTENKLSGRPDDKEQDTTAAGGSQSAQESDGDPTPGKRIELEKAQATRQWLNSIRDNPSEFLAKRIEQEMYRRQAAGTSPPKSRDPW